MFSSGLLVLTAPIYKLQRQIPAILGQVGKLVDQTLYVHIVPGLNDASKKEQASPAVDSIQLASLNQIIIPYCTDIKAFLLGLYRRTALQCQNIDVRILLENITNKNRHLESQKLQKGYEVIFTDLGNTVSSQNWIKRYVELNFPQTNVVQDQTVPCHFLAEVVENSTTVSAADGDLQSDTHRKMGSDIGEKCNTYGHVVLGGTFDCLHIGHKILLTEACLSCEEQLVIGVTDGAMNSKKTLCELIEPTVTRIDKLHEFLKDVKPSLRYRLEPIVDPFGPSIVVPELQCIVVSEETLKGGHAVNLKRQERGLSTLDVDVIELVEDDHHSPEEEEKISSSTQRKRLLGTLLFEPKDGPTFPPYIIGLTGGIASGKSSICRRLEGLGAKIIDCDKLGHKAYAKGTACLEQVVEAFGPDVLGPDGEINRKALGKVFSDKKQLDKLSAIVWPVIADLAKMEIQKFVEQGHGVMVLDAAVLLEAGWDRMVHEVWVAIIPRNEAVKRIVDRNKVEEAEAERRIDSQLNNHQRVERANVVLSTLWSPDVTQKQVEKAWELLQERIRCTSSARL